MKILASSISALRLLGISTLFLLPSIAAAEGVCDRPLVAGWEAWEPYQFEEGGELKGYDVEVIRAVVADMGCEVEYRELPWVRHLGELEKGQVDIASGAAKTAEREAFARYSLPYRQDEVRLWVRAGETGSFPYVDLAALAASDFRLGVTRSYVYGPIYGALLKDGAFDRERLIQVDSELQLFPMLARKRVDGFLVERSNFAVQARKQNLEGKFEAHPMPISTDAAYILLSRKSISDEIHAAFNLSLEKLRADGTLGKIEAKYLE